jgi:hypothetical protein
LRRTQTYLSSYRHSRKPEKNVRLNFGVAFVSSILSIISYFAGNTFLSQFVTNFYDFYACMDLYIFSLLGRFCLVGLENSLRQNLGLISFESLLG